MNIHLRFVALLVFSVFTTVMSMGLPSHEITDMAKNEPVQNAATLVSGVVRLVGNEPFTELVISNPEIELYMEWYIERDEEYKLKNYQHRKVTVEGVEDVEQLMFASGLAAGERRTIREIKIINVE